MSIFLIATAICAHGQASLQIGSRTVKHYVPPVYPELARHMNVKGTVRIEVVISAAGKVVSATAVGGHPVLAESAVMAVKGWKFLPGPQDTTTTVTINFE